MALDTVSIGSMDYPVYGSLSRAEEYLSAAAHATTWNSDLTNEQKSQYLVTVTRLLNRQNWKGTKVVSDQALAFPREGMGISPEPLLDDNDIPVDIVYASFELALTLADGSDVQNQQTTAERIRSMTAGSVSITYAWSAFSTTSRFPQIVQELLRMYLAGSGTGFAGVVTGVDGETSFPADLGLTGGL